MGGRVLGRGLWRLGFVVGLGRGGRIDGTRHRMGPCCHVMLVYKVYTVEKLFVGLRSYQTRMNPTQDSSSNAHARTTQYISHGVNSAGSEVLRAL